MKIILVDNEKQPIGEYIEAIRKVDSTAMVRGFHVDGAYSHIVKKEIANLSFPMLNERRRIHAKTFGQFEAYIDGIPITSKYNKTRELFAFLLDRNGSMADLHEIQSVLWEGDACDHTSYLKNIRADMISTLNKHGMGEVLVRQHGRVGIIPDLIECDYFDMLAGKESAILRYKGEYMSQYSWAEFTNAILMDIKEEYNMTHVVEE